MVWSDNRGAEQATRKGRSRAFDHTCLVHALWIKAIQLNLAMEVWRVPTHENIADLPSRREHGLLRRSSFRVFRVRALVCAVLFRRLGSMWVRPYLEPRFCSAGTWSALSLKGVFRR